MPDPTIDYGHPKPKRRPSAGFWAVLVICVVVLLLMIEPLCSSRPSRATVNQDKCAINLHEIGRAIYLHAQANAGAFPPDLQTLLATQPLSAQVFLCPSTSDTPANGPSGLSQPGHCSYIYVGANLNQKSNRTCIVALDDPADHNLEGANILFADGHVEWLGLPFVIQTLKDLASGRNPPRLGNVSPATMTSSMASSAKSDYAKNWQSRMPQLKSGVWPIPTTQPTSKPRHVE